MNRPLLAMLWLVFGLALAPDARAAPPAIAQAEINYLLVVVESSACEFFRNGSWYDAKKAAAHLRDKYDILEMGNQIQTAEDFIEEAATKCGLSGQPYQVRCSGDKAITTNQWLRDFLRRYRAHTTPGTGISAPDVFGRVSRTLH